MAGMNYVCLYISYSETLAPFSNEEIGKMVNAMLSYAATGEIPQFDGNERFIWPTLKAQIDRDEAAYQERCEKNRLNGAKGGRPTKNQTVISETEGFSEKPKKPKEKEKEKEKEKKKESIEAGEPPPTPPNTGGEGDKPQKHKHGEYQNVLLTDDELKKLQAEIPGYEDFIGRLSEYMASTGKKYKSHYATIRSWARRERKTGRPVQSFPDDDLNGIF